MEYTYQLIKNSLKSFLNYNKEGAIAPLSVIGNNAISPLEIVVVAIVALGALLLMTWLSN